MRLPLLLLLLLAPLCALAQGAPDAGTPAEPQLTKAPVLVRQVEAPFPEEARAQGLSGTVVLQVDVSETGAVTDVQVLTPAGHGFDEAAVEAVRQFVFEPAEVDGQPAPVRITYRYEFVWREPPAPQAPAGATAAETGPVNLSGRVLERGTRKPLVGAEVALPALGRSTTTDADGAFGFRGVPEGEHEVVVVLTGYERFGTRERVSAGRETRATYHVRRRFFSPFETVVRGERERKEVTQTVLRAAEVQRIPGTQGDTLKVVQNLPGVARPAFNGGQLVIRGTSPNDSGVFLDGLRIPILFHFGGLTSVYNAELLDTVSYLPGTFGAYYGNVYGGAIDVQSRAPRTDRLHGTAGVSLIESNLVLEGPLTDTLSVAVAGRRSYVDVVLRALPDEVFGSSLDVAPRYYDAQLKLEWRPTREHSVSLLALSSDDVFALLIERPADADPSVAGRFELQTGFQQVRLRHRYRSERLRLDTQGMVGRNLVRVAVGAQRGFDLLGPEVALRHTAEWSVSEQVELAGGFDVLYSRARIRAELNRPPQEGEPFLPGAVTEVVTVDGDYSQYFPGVWAEARLRPLKGLLLVPGLRSESYLFTEQTGPRRSLNPRLGVRYQLDEAWTLKAGAGLYHSPPQQAEPTRAFGNPDLAAKRARQLSAGVEWTGGNAWFASLEAFDNRLDRLIVSTDARVERDGREVPLLLDNAGVGRVVGLELLVRRALTERFFGWLAYTLSRSERRDRPGERVRLFDNDQTHVLTAIGSYRLAGGWEVGARFRLASGNPYTPVVGARRDDLADVFVPLFGATNARRLPLFHQLDVRVDKTFVFERWNLDVFLDATNVYNERAVEGVTYSYNYAEQGFFRGLPVLPVLGVRGSF